MPAEVTAIYDRIGSADLFGGAWRLLPSAEHRMAWDAGRRTATARQHGRHMNGPA
jgi:hypothetical protein